MKKFETTRMVVSKQGGIILGSEIQGEDISHRLTTPDSDGNEFIDSLKNLNEGDEVIVAIRKYK